MCGAVACNDGNGITEQPRAPRLISIVPRTGYAGCTAIISGNFFSGNTSENIVTVDGEQIPVTASTDNRLTLTMPEHELGDVEVAVSVAGRDAETVLKFTYSTLPEIVMSVSSIQPSSGFAGDRLVISGENFSTFPADNKVTFGGVAAEVVKATQNTLEVIAPEHARGNVEVVVTVNGKSSGTSFRYVELLIESNLPVSGAEGVEVTIKGEGFSATPTDNAVSINGVTALVKSASPEELVVIVPDNPEGTYPFVVNTGGRTVTGGEFTYSGCWRVETVLGVTSGVTGNVDGTGVDARLWYAQDIVLKKDGSYLMTLRQKDHGIYSMTADYSFRKLVNQGDDALLNVAYPWGCALDSKETLYFAAKNTGKLLTYTSDGVLGEYAIADLTTKGMNPMDVVIDREDNIYLLLRGSSSAGNGKVVKIKDHSVLQTYDLAGMKLYESLLLSYDGSRIFLFGNGTGDMRMIDLATGDIKVIAGTGVKYSNADTYTDGTPGDPMTATFNLSEGGVCFEDGTIIFGEAAAATLREFKPGEGGDYTKGTITTIAGTAYQKTPADGMSSSARFNYPNGMCIAQDGRTIYMLDGTSNATLKKIYYR